jgi:HK97 family phage major capsid protein
MRKAYALIDVKSFDVQKREFTGTATSPVTDRMGDVIEPAGVQYANPLPLLLYHDSKKPVGQTRFGKATPTGVPFSATISTIDRPGVVKDRLDEAVDSLNAQPPLIRGVSIGFRELEDPVYMPETGGYRFSRIEVLELSMVTIPANQAATIDNVKAFDLASTDAAAIGTASSALPLPGVTGASRIVRMRSETSMKKSIADLIAGWETTRAQKAARQTEIQQKATDEGRVKDEAESVEFKEIETDLGRIDGEIADLKLMQSREVAAAVVVRGETAQLGSVTRPATTVSITRNLPKGFLFARYAICMANSRGIPGEAIRLAKEHYRDDPGVVALVEKTAVAGGATSGSHWLDDMVPYNVMADFIEYLRPGSIIGKFGGPNPGAPGRNYPALRRVGFNERVSGMSTGFTAGWKGEGLPALPSAAVTFNTALLWNCMSALAILTKEAVRFSNPSAEMQVRDDLARAVNQKLDNDFVDPAKAVSGTTSPASITNGVVATAPSGTAATNVRHDLAALLGLFAGNNLVGSDLTLIMSATEAAQISNMVNALGQPDFPTLTMEGGYLAGMPVIVSELLTSLGSPSTQMIVMVKAGDVYLADDGVVTVEASDQASVEMVDTSSQSAISGTGASLVSLWQTGAIGLLANREITWKKRRSTAVQYLSPCAYVVPTS